MQNWDLILQAGSLKLKQEELQSCYTGLIDAANGMQEILKLLQTNWQGTAAKQYLTTVYQELEEFYDEAEKLQELAGLFGKLEKGFMSCENQITGMIEKKKWGKCRNYL